MSSVAFFVAYSVNLFPHLSWCRAIHELIVCIYDLRNPFTILVNIVQLCATIYSMPALCLLVI
jgi:hypothetical protein